MKFKAAINIMPQKALLDPQGKTVANNMENVGVTGITKARIGKRIHLELQAKDQQEAEEKVQMACQKLLVNKIMEEYTFEVSPI